MSRVPQCQRPNPAERTGGRLLVLGFPGQYPVWYTTPDASRAHFSKARALDRVRVGSGPGGGGGCRDDPDRVREDIRAGWNPTRRAGGEAQEGPAVVGPSPEAEVSFCTAHSRNEPGCYGCNLTMRHQEAVRDAALTKRYRRDMRVLKVLELVAMLCVFGALVYYR